MRVATGTSCGEWAGTSGILSMYYIINNEGCLTLATWSHERHESATGTSLSHQGHYKVNVQFAYRSFEILTRQLAMDMPSVNSALTVSRGTTNHAPVVISNSINH